MKTNSIKILFAIALFSFVGCKSDKSKEDNAQKKDVLAATSTNVNVKNYIRAESDFQLKGYAAKGAFGKLLHLRGLYSVENQTTVRGNRDTYYSFGVFDLTSPITITKPESDGRFMSLLFVSQDHSIPAAIHEAGTIELTQEKIGSRYVFVIFRTFANPNDPADVEVAHKLQDAIIIEQQDKGELILPNWDEKRLDIVRDSLNVFAIKVKTFDALFGLKEDVDPEKALLAASFGWGGNPKEAAIYRNFAPEKNDGKTPYKVVVKNVPVDGFWSISMYNKDGYFEKNDKGLYTYNNITAKKDEDGSITINFGGDPNQTNYLPITEGWNYIVRLYQPREELLNGSWVFPEPELVE